MACTKISKLDNRHMPPTPRQHHCHQNQQPSAPPLPPTTGNCQCHPPQPTSMLTPAVPKTSTNKVNKSPPTLPTPTRQYNTHNNGNWSVATKFHQRHTPHQHQCIWFQAVIHHFICSYTNPPTSTCSNRCFPSQPPMQHIRRRECRQY